MLGRVLSWNVSSAETNGAMARRRIHPELGQPIGEPHVVGDLRRRHAGQRRPAGQGGRQPGVLGQPIEGGQFRVGEHAQQVDDGSAVDRGHGHLLELGGRSAGGDEVGG